MHAKILQLLPAVEKAKAVIVSDIDGDEPMDGYNGEVLPFVRLTEVDSNTCSVWSAAS